MKSSLDIVKSIEMSPAYHTVGGMRYRIIETIDKAIKGTPKRYEATVKKRLSKDKIVVMRFDHKDSYPDWLAVDGEGFTSYHEVKRYLTVKNLETALKKWTKSQAKQKQTMLKLSEFFDVFMHIALADKQYVIKIWRKTK